MDLKVKKYTNIKTGLKKADVAKNKTNEVETKNSRSYKQIVHDNVFTLFNLINLILGLMVFVTGSYRNMLFVLLVLINMIIGIIQEIRSKNVLDELALLNVKKAKVLRDSRIEEIPAEEIVENDVLIVEPGDQMSVDAVVLDGHVECNESILTGESDAIEKTFGDTLMSGSFIVSGKAKAQAVRVGDDTYSYSIMNQAKREKRYPSELRDSIQTIIRFSTIILIPSGLVLLYKELFIEHLLWQEAFLSTVAAVIGMIPEGLVLLTSTALAIGSIKLAQKKVLIQELYCIETLARVDTLCLDKTGTITEGKMKVMHIECLDDITESEVKDILAEVYTALDDNNATAQAIREFAGQREAAVSHTIPFSSDRKASGVEFADGNCFIIGAYSFVQQNTDPQIQAKIDSYAEQGMRVIVLAHASHLSDTLKGNHRILALICIQDVLREDIKETLDYFEDQGVDIKIISGDDPLTVTALAKKAGVRGRPVDMSKVKDIPKAVERYSIFGRVTPEQKKEMVLALKEQGHTVAMTGDGVNDVMALKEADCSIAMGTGSQAAKAISSVVLLNDQFDALPSVLREGRIVINNIQRSASLFLVKTLFSLGLTLITIFWLSAYPFKPIQLSLVSGLGTGIPGFVLALEPNEERVHGHFLRHVFGRAIPGAASVILSVVICYQFKGLLGMSSAQLSTICTIVATWNSLCVLYTVCEPMTRIRNWLMTAMLLASIIGMLGFHDLLYLTGLSVWQTVYLVCNMALIPDFLIIVKHVVDKTILRDEAQYVSV